MAPLVNRMGEDTGRHRQIWGSATRWSVQPEAPEVRQTIEDAIGRVRAAGKAAGVLTRVPESAARYIDMGATFVAVGTDAGLLAEGSDRLRAAF